jgi:hypothetical protein
MKGKGLNISRPRPIEPSFIERLENSAGTGRQELIRNATTDELIEVLPILRERMRTEIIREDRNLYNATIRFIESILRDRPIRTDAFTTLPVATIDQTNNEDNTDLPQANAINGSGLNKPNAWISHCKKYQQKHNCTWKEAMMGAKATYKKGGNIKFPNGLTKEQMEAYKAKGQYVSNGRWMQLQNGKYTWWPSKTGGFIVDPKTGRMYHDNDPKAQKWKK